MIMEQCTQLGFLAITNIPNYNEEELLKQQKWFFSQSDEVKRKLYKKHFNKENTNVYRGFAPFI